MITARFVRTLHWLIVPALFCTLSMCGSRADAVTIAEYFNDYGTTSVRPLNGFGAAGDGWAGPWQGTTQDKGMGYEAQSTLFNNIDYLNTGNATGAGDGRAFRSGGESSAGEISTRSFAGGLGGEVWMSAVARHASNDDGDLLLWFDTSSSGQQANTFVGLRSGDVPNMRFSGTNTTAARQTSAGQNLLMLTRVRIDQSGSYDSIDYWIKKESDDLSTPAALGAPLLSNSGADAFGDQLNYIGVSGGLQPANLDSLRISNDPNAFEVVLGREEPTMEHDYDVVVYGGTAGGITAAVQAARMGQSVAVIEPTTRIGGMTTNGLGFTDTGNRDAIQGIAREFYARAHGHAGEWSDYSGSFNITPGTALTTLQTMASEAGVHVYYGERLDRDGAGVTIDSGAIQSIRTESGHTFSGSVFIDAGYEGDLMAEAGVSYTVGREANAQYGERYNGVQIGAPGWNNHNFNDTGDGFTAHVSPYVVPGDPSSGLLPGIDPTGPGTTGTGDNRLQSYNFRLTLTRDADRRTWTAPPGYDASQYELLSRVIADNNITDLNKVLKIDTIGDGKYDLNNRGPVSTDFIGQNYDYPEADYATREQILTAHRYWQQGLLYFLATDAEIPQSIRDAMNSYGLTADEFLANDGWSEQIYVREARRMLGRYVMTDLNVRGLEEVADSIGLAAYTMDSHHTQRYVVDPDTPDAYVLNEGNVQVGTPEPYPISYRAITPEQDEVTNLLVTSALSSSHIAYGSIRMEPVFMTLGQAGGTAAAMAIDQGIAVQDLDYLALRAQLIADDALLEWPVNLVPYVGTIAADFNHLAELPADMRHTTGGINMVGDWDGTGTLTVLAGDLTYAGGGYAVVQQGSALAGCVQGDYDEPRQNIRDLAGTMQGEIWMSLLLENPDETAVVGLSLNPTTNGDPNDGPIFNWIGINGDQLQVTWDNTTSTSLATLATGETHLLLMRLLADPSGNDTLEVWADPADLANLGAADFSSSDLDVLGSLYRIGALSYNPAGPAFSAQGGLLDAIRISNEDDAYLAVIGVPEPGTLALVISGLLAMGLFLRRSRPRHVP